MKSRLLFSLALILSLAAPQVFAGDKDDKDHGNPRIVPPHQRYEGKTYEQWSARWWQWAFSMEVYENPLFDTTGELAANGQTGDVWFLCGVFIGNGSAERTITVPQGKALFFPIMNNEGSLVEYWWYDTIEEVAADNARGADPKAIGSMSCTIDGKKLGTHDLLRYRVTSFVKDRKTHELVPDPLMFAIDLPEGDSSIIGVDGIPVSEDPRNLLQAWNKNPDVDPDDLIGEVYPVVGDGYYLLVEPLAPGKHEIHFKASTWIDITYHITVVPSHHGHHDRDRD
jgi:hypothetical protein